MGYLYKKEYGGDNMTDGERKESRIITTNIPLSQMVKAVLLIKCLTSHVK